MLIAAAALTLALQVQDTTRDVYDSPATRALVQRAIAASGEIPADLLDYEAEVQSSMYITVAPDSVAGGDLPAAVDELVSTVRWERAGGLHQVVRGHRTRMLIPLPYTLATVAERPWVIPPLYGSSLFTPFAGPRAISPFGARGPEVYRYVAEDTVRIRVQGVTVSLVPVSVRPRVEPSAARPLLVLGTFYLDVERAAVARARFGFVGDAGTLPRSLGQLETFLELDNALWEGRYWLPFQQRREVAFYSRMMGGTVTTRVVNRFVGVEFNRGWRPAAERIRLSWERETGAFSEWRAEIGEDAGEFASSDFTDLRIATETADPDSRAPQLQLHFDRANHLFRYNRVEGAYLGLGARITAPDPRRDRWEVYGTAGWAFAEATARGELGTTWGDAVAPAPGDRDHGGRAGVYRRLRDIQPFRPSFDWDWIYTIPAALWGSDTRDYYDATGAEAIASLRRGRWSARAGGRVEAHDPVAMNTESYLFGRAEEFGPLATVEPGTHAALEIGGGYALGPGAFGIGNSAIARADVEIGVGDFRYNRLVGLLSLRYLLGPFTLATRVDGGHAWAGVPPQKLFRFGSAEGLRGYDPNEFGGSTALLGRGRLLVGIPPRSTRPLARIGWFLVPPLRPSFVLLGETGWTRVDADLRDELLRLRARPTGGARSGVGAGVSVLEDAFSFEYLHPVGAGSAQRDGRWYVGLTYWY